MAQSGYAPSGEIHDRGGEGHLGSYQGIDAEPCCLSMRRTAPMFWLARLPLRRNLRLWYLHKAPREIGHAFQWRLGLPSWPRHERNLSLPPTIVALGVRL